MVKARSVALHHRRTDTLTNQYISDFQKNVRRKIRREKTEVPEEKAAGGMDLYEARRKVEDL